LASASRWYVRKGLELSCRWTACSTAKRRAG
jgi:hypothetical protein